MTNHFIGFSHNLNTRIYQNTYEPGRDKEGLNEWMGASLTEEYDCTLKTLKNYKIPFEFLIVVIIQILWNFLSIVVNIFTNI